MEITITQKTTMNQIIIIKIKIIFCTRKHRSVFCYASIKKRSLSDTWMMATFRHVRSSGVDIKDNSPRCEPLQRRMWAEDQRVPELCHPKAPLPSSMVQWDHTHTHLYRRCASYTPPHGKVKDRLTLNRGLRIRSSTHPPSPPRPPFAFVICQSEQWPWSVTK